jgi:hypothetical protein
MKSRLLAKQLQEIFGGEGEPQFRQLLERRGLMLSRMRWPMVLIGWLASSIRPIALTPASI